jgi:hypothetical protein
MDHINPFEDFSPLGNGTQLPFPEITNGPTIGKVHLPFPPAVIEGMICRGEKGELAGGSKSFKTWALIQQGLCIAAGLPWWGFETHSTNVLFLNLEIPPAFFEWRVRLVASALAIPIPENFYVWHLRNEKLGDPSRWGRFLDILKNKCSLIAHPFLTSDPIYKLLGGRNENAAGDVQLLLGQLDEMIALVDGANFFGHHYSKGNQSNKEAIDRAAGSGVFQRDPDSILTMTTHEKANCYTLEFILRNHPPVEPCVIKWTYPIFIREDALDPQALKQPRKSGPTSKFQPKQIAQILGSQEMTTTNLKKLVMDETGMSKSLFFELLATAQEQKLIAKDGITNTWERVAKS